jgi:hypothetical protein
MDPAYKKAMTTLVDELPVKFKNHVHETLIKKGYHASVCVDETQAYMATNTMVDTDKMFDPSGIHAPWQHILQFQKVFHKQYEEYQNDKKG